MADNSTVPSSAQLDHIASTSKAVLGCIAFAVFWMMAVFPSVRFLPIGRTAGALMSAALMVAFKVLTPSEAFAAINLPTIGLLFGTMIVSTFLERAGAFEYLGCLLAWRSLGGADLLCRLCVFSAISAALLTNDTTCVILTSFILGLCRAKGLPPQAYLIALATSANIGSALTPIGNPQNLIISINGKVWFGKFLAGLAAAVVVTVLVNMAGLLLIYWRRLTKKRLARRLEEGQAREDTEAEKPADGANDEGAETSGALAGEEASLGKLERLQNESRIGRENREKATRGSPMVRMRSLSARESAEKHLPTPQRSLSLGSRKRWREEYGGEIDLPAVLHFNGSVKPIASESSADSLGTERMTGDGTSGGREEESSEGARTTQSKTPASDIESAALETPGTSGQPSAERPDGRSDPNKDQIEVLVSPPYIENWEDGPVVAPTGRGRLKRLRKKRPLWLFKACVYIVVVGMLAALLAGLDLPWVATGAAVILICLDFRDAEETLDQVSYSLLVFFGGLFIAVEGFNQTGVPGQIWAWLEPHARLDTASGTVLLAAVVTLLSNVASNVPTVLLLGPRLAASAATTSGISETYAWLFLAFTSTVAGNLTMVGSAATLIVSEEAFRAKDGLKYKLSFWNHLRYGLPSTIIVLAVGIPLILS